MDSSKIMMLLSRLKDLSHNRISDELKNRGMGDLEPAHGDIFAALNRHGELKMSDLAEITGRKKNTITVLAKKLIERGYLNNRVDPLDNRIRLLSLSKKTVDLAPDRKEISEIILNRIYKDFTQNDKDVLISLLEKVYTNLKE